MNRLAIVLCAGIIAVSARAFERPDLQGLRVEVERINEPVAVDGVQMRIQRAQGRDTVQLAHRMESRWRRAAGHVSRLEQSGWQIVTRWYEGKSELIQWRDSTTGPELLYSVVDVVQSTRRTSPPPFSLPARCQWGRVIEGSAAQQQFAQHSAYCRMRKSAVPDALRPHLHAQGWTVRRDTAAALDVERADQRGVLLLGEAGAGTTVVWLGVGAFSGHTP